MDLQLVPNHGTLYPVLTQFLADEPQLRALHYLPHVCEWQHLLLTRYSRSISHTQAQHITVHQVFMELSETELPIWKTAFHGYANAWNMAWKYVERFGCMPIPALYKTMVMDEDTPIAFSLASEKDEGRLLFFVISLSSFVM